MGIRDKIEERLQETIEEQSDEITEESNEEVQSEEVQEQHSEEWNPNYTYKANNQEHEFDEWIRPIVKDAETESQVRELYSRARGLENVKGHLQREMDRSSKLEQEIISYKQEADLARQGVEGLKKLAKDDFASFAHLTGLDDQTILGYANARLDYKEKPDYERRQIDQDMERRSQSYQSNVEVENLRRQNHQLMQQQHQSRLVEAMSNPEIGEFQKVFDERMGEGAFRQHVNNYGSSQYRATQQYVEPQVAVQHVYAQFKPLFIEKLETINEKGSKNKVTKPPTNLGAGRTSSVVTKRVKRLSDLRKKANELAKAEGYGGNYA